MASPPRPVLATPLLVLLLLLPGNAAASSPVNPFTAKAAFIRYWNRKVPNNRPHPAFFVSKLSPLPAADAASFPSSLPDIRARLPTLCSKAALLCPSSSDSDSESDVAARKGPFTSYRDANFTNGRSRGFTSYAQESNGGESSFAGYGKSGNSLRESFASYGNDTNTLSSGFANYGESANGATDTFTGYGVEGNVPENTFRSYGAGANAGVDSFKGYRDGANVGDDSFASYVKGANGGAAEFESYGGSANAGSVDFKGYGQGSNRNHEIGFKAYAGDNTTFKAYAETGVDFKEYHNTSSATATTSASEEHRQHLKTKWSPEPGKFFRERELVAGNRMPMPDIRDKMPPRAFLPRDIARKIPFEASAVSEAFRAAPDTALGKAVASTVAECERAPSRGETKRCATSAEDVVDFAVEMLGDDIVVRSTASTAGSGAEVRLGSVTGGEAAPARAVSCHQSLFPYLVYYCHSVPRARVYEADIMSAAGDGRKINRGVAICHLDTSDWSPSHGAFVLLGGEPGKTEVCHWIFEGDMTWTVAD
ncbi:unnamed protein product [Triticum turgidum subsp. durum]|uniref:BURP domain-containing protein n=1 Tax=Triticum turgidum subsp. durum TaxID=4567 RepID=A0A9R1BIQ4_TRITD|nr:unnamed protein product [Triticum turgidum subsp. durum]